MLEGFFANSWTNAYNNGAGQSSPPPTTQNDAVTAGSNSTTNSTGTSTNATSAAGTGATHFVHVGSDNGTPGLVYTPSVTYAQQGDIVVFLFTTGNHTVTQAAFASPCSPLSGGFSSAFEPIAAGSTDFPGFVVTVENTNPIWFYCEQANHCPSGMVGAINPPSSGNTFQAFQTAALALGSGSGAAASPASSSSPASGSASPNPSAGTTTASTSSSSENPLESEITALMQANTAIDRYGLLGSDSIMFGFLDAPSFGGGGKAGGVVLADDTIYPAVIGNNIAMLMGFLGPCGMVAPHSHPRATEILVNVAGPPLMAGLITEGGAPTIIGYAGPGNVTVLPQGSTHFVASTGCEPTVIVAAFNSESPGALFVSQSYAAFSESTYEAAFGGIGVQMLAPSAIPNAVNIGQASCLAKCGINPATYDISNVTKTELMMGAFAGYLTSNNYSLTNSSVAGLS